MRGAAAVSGVLGGGCVAPFEGHEDTTCEPCQVGAALAAERRIGGRPLPRSAATGLRRSAPVHTVGVAYRPSGVTAAAVRAIPVLLVLLLLALTMSITAVDTLMALLIIATLLPLTDPARRSRYRLPLLLPMLTFAVLTLVSAAAGAERAVPPFESKPLIALPLFFIAVNRFGSWAAWRRGLARVS